MYQKHDFEIFTLSALEKVRGEVRPQLFERENTALTGEKFCFQVAYRSIGQTRTDLSYSVTGIPDGCVRVDLVGDVPCTLPALENSDDYLLTDHACMMPDVLRPVSEAGIVAKCGAWQSFFVTVRGLPAGTHRIIFCVKDGQGEVLGEADYTLRVLPQELPENDLICTIWLHCDSLAGYYRLPLFSEEYNSILRSFVRSAVEHGLTMILVPMFTPPLDTKIGGERMTVQLVDVERRGGQYSFGFERLGWFMNFCEECGVKYFEMSHLFSQWGAECAPKIVAVENGQQKKIFGWETKALSEEYRAFLAAFLPKLREWLTEKGYYSRCYFHISDEPGELSFAHYKECHDLVKKYLPDAKFVDAMSHYEFYEKKLVDIPFVAIDWAQEFIDKGAKDYFVYYCTSQRRDFVSNRFLAMPLERTRILGMQLYLNDVKGFLQWGYNYYYSFLSLEPVDPFATTDCMGKYQSGDAFIVYPGREGALESLRNEAFLQGLQDLRALRLLEKKIGRKRTVALLEENGMAKNFTDYPKSALWLIGLRKKINELIENS